MELPSSYTERPGTRGPKPKLIEYDGLKLTYQGWAIHLDIQVDAVKKRLKKYPIEFALSRSFHGGRVAKLYRAFGEDMSIGDMANVAGITYTAMSVRLKSMSAEEAIAYTPHQKPKKPASMFIVTTPNGQVFDHSKHKRRHIPKVVAYSCVDCGCFRYKHAYSKSVRCARCACLHGSKAHAVQKNEKYAKLYAEGYVYKAESSSAKKRAKKFGCEYVIGITTKAVADKYNNECQECGITMQKHGGGWHPEGWTIGHIIPMSLGGGHTWDNVQAECIACNLWKGNRELEIDWDEVG